MRMPKFTNRWIIVVVAMVFLSLAWLAWSYKISRFRGDGAISDRGFWSYPRYRIRFSPIELRAGQACSYRFRGAPPVPLSLKLELADPPSLDDTGTGTASSAETQVSITIADGNGNVLVSAAGPLKSWKLAQSRGYAAYWHPDSIDAKFREGTAYTMTISTSGEGVIPALVIVPTLEGGGTELP